MQDQTPKATHHLLLSSSPFNFINSLFLVHKITFLDVLKYTFSDCTAFRHIFPQSSHKKPPIFLTVK